MDISKELLSYFKNRPFIAQYNSLYFDELDSYSGVPQGSNIGPLLFLF